MQVYHGAAVVVVLTMWALDREHARRIGAAAERILQDDGRRKRRHGHIFTVEPSELEAVLRRAAALEGLRLMTDAERLHALEAEEGRQLHRLLGE